MNKTRNYEMARILKDSLRIVDKLGEIDDVETNIDLIEELIHKAKKIKKSVMWKL